MLDIGQPFVLSRPNESIWLACSLKEGDFRTLREAKDRSPLFVLSLQDGGVSDVTRAR